MKNIILSIFILCYYSSISQNINYKSKYICSDSTVIKGKKNHGEYYCTGWIGVRVYKDGTTDTVGELMIGTLRTGDEIYKYPKLSERGKYIIDSLKEDGISQLTWSYLLYEPKYMKLGKKIEQFWEIENGNIIVYYYEIWNTANGSGYKLIRQKEIKQF